MFNIKLAISRIPDQVLTQQVVDLLFKPEIKELCLLADRIGCTTDHLLGHPFSNRHLQPIPDNVAALAPALPPQPAPPEPPPLPPAKKLRGEPLKLAVLDYIAKIRQAAPCNIAKHFGVHECTIHRLVRDFEASNLVESRRNLVTACGSIQPSIPLIPPATVSAVQTP